MFVTKLPLFFLFYFLMYYLGLLGQNERAYFPFQNVINNECSDNSFFLNSKNC